MLREYRLTNFKAFGETVTIPIRPLTLIFGANSSGKSSIFQSLLLLKQTLEEAKDPATVLLPKGSLVDLGTYRDFVHRHETERDFEFGARFDLKRPLILSRHETVNEADLDIRITYSQEDSDHVLTISKGKVAVGDEKQLIASYSHKVVVGDEKLPMGSRIPGMDPYCWDTRFHPEAKFWDRWGNALCRCYDESTGYQNLASLILDNFGEQHRLPLLLPEDMRTELMVQEWAMKTSKNVYARHLLGELDSVFEASSFALYCKRFLPQDTSPEPSLLEVIAHQETGVLVEWTLLPIRRSGSSFRAILNDLIYLGPLRGQPQRHYEFNVNSIPHLGHSDDVYVGQSGEYLPAILSQVTSDRDDMPLSLWDIDDDLEQLGIKYRVELSKLKYENGNTSNLFSLRLVDTDTGIDASLRDVGFGISQVLPIVVQNRVSWGKTLLIEQPEIHLHPAHQAELGDMFIRSALGGQKNTLLLETHSEHLILRILRRIRETTENGKPSDEVPKIYPKDVAVLYIQPGENGAQVIEIPVTEDGDFAEKWPRGFFTERAKELF